MSVSLPSILLLLDCSQFSWSEHHMQRRKCNLNEKVPLPPKPTHMTIQNFHQSQEFILPKFHNHLKDFMLEITKILALPLSFFKKLAQSGWHTTRLSFLFSSALVILWLISRLSQIHPFGKKSLPLHTKNNLYYVFKIVINLPLPQQRHSWRENDGNTYWELQTPAVVDVKLGKPAVLWHRSRHLSHLLNSPHLLWLLVLKLH